MTSGDSRRPCRGNLDTAVAVPRRDMNVTQSRRRGKEGGGGGYMKLPVLSLRYRTGGAEGKRLLALRVVGKL